MKSLRVGYNASLKIGYFPLTSIINLLLPYHRKKVLPVRLKYLTQQFYKLVFEKIIQNTVILLNQTKSILYEAAETLLSQTGAQ